MILFNYFIVRNEKNLSYKFIKEYNDNYLLIELFYSFHIYLVL